MTKRQIKLAKYLLANEVYFTERAKYAITKKAIKRKRRRGNKKLKAKTTNTHTAGSYYNKLVNLDDETPTICKIPIFGGQ